jgi:hypothetical protein
MDLTFAKLIPIGAVISLAHGPPSQDPSIQSDAAILIQWIGWSILNRRTLLKT